MSLTTAMDTDSKSVEFKHDAHELAKGYSSTYRKVEVGGIVAFFSLTFAIGVKAWPVAKERPVFTAVALFVGFLMADFVSGFVHWMADTWGSTKLKYIGQSLVRPFREHHIVPKAMTLHDYVETNGNNCLISIPVAAMCLMAPLHISGFESLAYFLMVSNGSMIFWVMMTNQFHKWAHFERHELPAIVVTLQDMRLILHPSHHQIHHTAPFDRYYCITTGWLNWPLSKIRFFKTLEKILQRTTGMIPRVDDIELESVKPVVQ
jgi:plasmanylethanolamine desaturase